jgi:hypothetical protein
MVEMSRTMRPAFETDSYVRLIAIATIAELLPSLALWVLSPTDSVRVWYPSLWSYMGEHFLPWAFIAIVLTCSLFRFRELSNPQESEGTVRAIRMTGRYYLLFFFTMFVSDLLATVFLAFWGWNRTLSLHTSMFDTGRITDYLAFREPIYLTVFVLASYALTRQAVERPSASSDNG